MSEVFFIADTHFNHKRIVEIREKERGRKFASLEEHDEELIRRWNAAVGKKDTPSGTWGISVSASEGFRSPRVSTETSLSSWGTMIGTIRRTI